ncbi:substrate-binding domain-containing protein [Paenibacillus fonticola]|uniref:substrate-binding domain-containing protein n=1 Tax=Paenibacillus fonticola TaxID=379896 RepID=UPI0003754355|nr:substrate-binding domain-containing protein [Paenibacillus fonticola]
MRGRILILINCVVLMALLIGSFLFVNRHMTPATPVIWYVPKALDSSVEFWVTLHQGVTAAAEEYGAQIIVKGTETESDSSGQITLLRQALVEKPDAVILAATDQRLLLPVAEELTAAGIKLLTVDSGLEGGQTASFIGTDNYEAGQKAGIMMAEAIRGEGLVGIINTVYGSEAALQREQGVRDTLRLYPRITVLESSYSGAIRTRAYELARKLLELEPELCGIVALNEPTAVGAAQAVAELQAVRQVKLIGFDSSMREVVYLEEGVLQATVVQKPFNMGYLAVKTAIDVIKGRDVNDVINTGSVVITKENMFVPEHQKLLFPFLEDTQAN